VIETAAAVARHLDDVVVAAARSALAVKYLVDGRSRQQQGHCGQRGGQAQ
jgi:hypothetical protein